MASREARPAGAACRESSSASGASASGVPRPVGPSLGFAWFCMVLRLLGFSAALKKMALSVPGTSFPCVQVGRSVGWLRAKPGG